MKRHTLVTVLVCLAVVLAGCSGWGTDGPTDDDTEPDEADDLEEASSDAEETESGGTDDTDEGNEGNESDESDEEDPEGEEANDTENDTADDSDDVPDESEVDDEQDDSNDGNDESNENNGDDATDEDGTALTVETADVVTGSPVSADVISLEQGGETIDEASGESATFDGLNDGEYELELQDSFGDWAYSDTITIDGEDATYVAEIDQGHTYWPRVVATVVDEDGDPIEGEAVTFNDNAQETDDDGTASHEIESSYTDEQEIVVEYDGQSETFAFDWESWDGGHESITFEAGSGESGEGVALALA